MSEQRIGGTTGSAQIPNRTTHITGWGHEVPAATLTNADLEGARMPDGWSDEA